MSVGSDKDPDPECRPDWSRMISRNISVTVKPGPSTNSFPILRHHGHKDGQHGANEFESLVRIRELGQQVENTKNALTTQRKV